MNKGRLALEIGRQVLSLKPMSSTKIDAIFMKNFHEINGDDRMLDAIKKTDLEVALITAGDLIIKSMAAITISAMWPGPGTVIAFALITDIALKANLQTKRYDESHCGQNHNNIIYTLLLKVKIRQIKFSFSH